MPIAYLDPIHDVTGAYVPPAIGGLQVSDFRITGELAGSKFRLFRAEHLASGQPVVLKQIAKERLAAEPDLANREIEIHSRLQHPNVIGFLGTFHNPDYTYLVLELAPGGDLDRTQEQQTMGRFDEARAVHMVSAIARALQYLHGQGVVHRDIKPENVLLGPGDRVRLADFGVAEKFGPAVGLNGHRPAITPRRMHFVAGTRDFIAPEVICQGSSGYDHRCDMWSLGALIFQILVGQPPFFEVDVHKTFDRITRADFAFPTGKDAISRDAKQLISGLLDVDPKRRLTTSQVLTSRWIVQHCGCYGGGAQQQCLAETRNSPRRTECAT